MIGPDGLARAFVLIAQAGSMGEPETGKMATPGERVSYQEGSYELTASKSDLVGAQARLIRWMIGVVGVAAARRNRCRPSGWLASECRPGHGDGNEGGLRRRLQDW